MKKYLFSTLLLAHIIVACGPLPKLGPETESKLATASETDCGFVQNSYGQRVSWKQSLPVKIYLDPSFPAEFEATLNKAAQRWEAVLNRSLFVFERSTKSSTAAKDNRSIIYWQDPWSETENSLQAISSLAWKNNQLIEADIKVDAQYYTFYTDSPSSTMDVHLESLMVHELGHALGLKHVGNGTSSVMLKVLNFLEKREAPTEEDKAHLKCEYN
jgi:predicted Zn-dependent protease